jgi:hypothetical protein
MLESTIIHKVILDLQVEDKAINDYLYTYMYVYIFRRIYQADHPGGTNRVRRKVLYMT